MRWSFGLEFWVLAVLSLAAAITYGALLQKRPPSMLRAGVKALAAAALAAACASAGAIGLAIALGFAALGDFLFAFHKKWLTVCGAVCFLLTQLAYLAALLPLWIFAGDLSPLWPRYAANALIIASVLGVLIWIAPKLRWWTLLIIPYALLLTAVCATAMWQDWRAWPAIAGGALWLANHIVFAATQFRGVAVAKPAQWWSYAAAHALLVTGIAWAAPHMN